MKVFTDRPIYSYAEGSPEKLKPLGTSSVPTSLPTTLSTTKEQKEAQRKADKEKRKTERTQKRSERKEVRQEKRAVRKAKRLAKKLLRAKDKTGRKRWFYPISRVFKGKKKQADGTIVEVAPNDVVTTSSGAQFDKTEIAKATGVSPQSVTPQMAEQLLVTTPQGTLGVTENTTLSPYIARPDENINPNASAEEVLNRVTTVYAPLSDNQEVVQGEDGAIYMSQETMSQQEEEISDEEFAKLKKSGKDEKKGLGVWGWVGVSAIIVGLGIGVVLIYKMSTSKK